MKFSFNQATLKTALKQRDISLWCCLGLSVSNILLVLKILSTEEHWVLIPQNDTDHRINMTSKAYSDEYFMEWASGVVSTVLNVNPDSVDWKVHQVLNITVQNYGAVKERLRKEAEIIKKDQVSTVFYPKKFTVNQSQKTVDVVGQHLAYFGKDSTPVATEKTFRLTWALRPRGLILLQDFQEIKNDKNNS